MRGLIAVANPLLRRYAVHGENGEYTTFEIVGGTELRLGEEIEGDFSRRNEIAYHYQSTKPGLLRVYVQDCHCSLEEAATWVGGSTLA